MYYILIRMEFIRREMENNSNQKKEHNNAEYNDSYSVVSFAYAQISWL